MGILPINECYLSCLEKSTKDNKTVSCDKASIFVLCSVTQAFFGGSSQPRDPGSLASPALADGFSTTNTTWGANVFFIYI